jgi:uroporphyrinogen decarboxylase
VQAAADLARLDGARTSATFAPVYETVARVRKALAPEVALIGFCGAPWTVATYMVAGRGSTDQAAARLWAYRDADGFAALIDMLVVTSIDYLDGQVRAGADVLQIFDTWAGTLPEREFERWVVAPTRRIVTELKRRHPSVPIIGFPRGAGAKSAHYLEATGVDGLGCDTSVPLEAMRALSQRGNAVQGNLDPLLLVAGGPALDARVRETLATMRGVPFIFNLGHGIVPETPPEHVARLVALVRASAAGD